MTLQILYYPRMKTESLKMHPYSLNYQKIDLDEVHPILNYRIGILRKAIRLHVEKYNQLQRCVHQPHYCERCQNASMWTAHEHLTANPATCITTKATRNR